MENMYKILTRIGSKKTLALVLIILGGFISAAKIHEYNQMKKENYKLCKPGQGINFSNYVKLQEAQKKTLWGSLAASGFAIGIGLMLLGAGKMNDNER